VCLFLCVCVCVWANVYLFCIVNIIWMQISILGFNYAYLPLLLRTCLQTSGVAMVVPNTKLYDAIWLPPILRSCIRALHAIPIRFHLNDYSVQTYVCGDVPPNYTASRTFPHNAFTLPPLFRSSFHVLHQLVRLNVH
jgi:hypothetical protein